MSEHQTETNPYSRKDRNLPPLMLGVAVFFGMLFFFTLSHPLYLYDSDDWTYVAASRHALPMPSQWNPARILPETLMALSAGTGAVLLMPLTDNYVAALSLSFALIVALMIACYMVLIFLLLRNSFALQNAPALLLAALFFLLHFLPFARDEAGGRRHLFYSWNVTCYFYYLIPALLCAALVLYLMMKKPSLSWAKKCPVRAGFLLLAFYLAVNSNLMDSGLLVAYVLWRILTALFRGRKQKEKTSLLQSAGWELVLLACWLCGAVLERTGGRANTFQESGFQIGEAFHSFGKSVATLYPPFLVLTLLLILAAFAVFGTVKKKGTLSDADRQFITHCTEVMGSMLLVMLYLIVLAARVNPAYLLQTDVMICWMFYWLLLTALCASYLCIRFPYAVCALPLLLFVLLFETVVDRSVFADSNLAGLHHAQIKELDDYLIAQITEADKAGEDTVEVHVYAHPSPVWPLSDEYGGERIANALYLHGVTTKHMHITLIRDLSFPLPRTERNGQ